MIWSREFIGYFVSDRKREKRFPNKISCGLSSRGKRRTLQRS